MKLNLSREDNMSHQTSHRKNNGNAFYVHISLSKLPCLTEPLTKDTLLGG